MLKPLLDLVLVHEPVVNRHGEVIGSAVTNLDIHDIARVSCTFGVDTYWIVTPFAEQQELTGRIIDHWLAGHGKSANPDRGEALSLIKVAASLDEVMIQVREKWPGVQVVATSARYEGDELVAYSELKAALNKGEPILLLFGTAWGLAPQVFEKVDKVLPPISGLGEYNHLSVRSAVAIILDRLLGR